MSAASTGAASAVLLSAAAAAILAFGGIIAPASAAAAAAHTAADRSRPGDGVAGARPAGRDRTGANGPKAPNGPPLVSGEGAFAMPSSAGDPTAPSAGRPLVVNGLGSPLCNDGAPLSATARSRCLTSGFVAAAAPTGNYGLDVHIETGFPDFEGEAAAFVEDYLIKPPWTALVWSVHALLSAMQWSYLLDILHSPAMRTVAGVLRAVQRTVTRPWLAAVLALASVLIAYRGIVKRRVAETLGEALAILAMMAAGLWMVADPLGTVGAVAGWADAASLQTLAAVSTGATGGPDEALTDAAGQVFGATVDAPWCYLEFGNVAWCDDPARLDGRLRAAGLRIAARKRAHLARVAGAKAARQREAVRLLRSAATNGEIFLSLVPNLPERNSINQQGSLLRTLCNSPSLSRCTGATASEAEFRGEGNLVNRGAGLVLIGAGALGMLLLLSFIVVRLLGAALQSLLLLLAAPIAVLMPAIGENGRASFRAWAGRLFGALAAKLIWSFLLGIVLVCMKLVLALDGLGWWVQWLLLSILWWGAFRRRHDLLGLAGIGRSATAGLDAGRRPTTIARVSSRAGALAWGLVLDRSGPGRRRQPSLPSPRSGPIREPPEQKQQQTVTQSEPQAAGTEQMPAGQRRPQKQPSGTDSEPSEASEQEIEPFGESKRSSGATQSRRSGEDRPGDLPRQLRPQPASQRTPPVGPGSSGGRAEEPDARADRSEGGRPASAEPAGEPEPRAPGTKLESESSERSRPEPSRSTAPSRSEHAGPSERRSGSAPDGGAKPQRAGPTGHSQPPDRDAQARAGEQPPARDDGQQAPSGLLPARERARFEEVVQRIRQDAKARRRAAAAGSEPAPAEHKGAAEGERQPGEASPPVRSPRRRHPRGRQLGER